MADPKGKKEAEQRVAMGYDALRGLAQASAAARAQKST